LRCCRLRSLWLHCGKSLLRLCVSVLTGLACHFGPRIRPDTLPRTKRNLGQLAVLNRWAGIRSEVVWPWPDSHLAAFAGVSSRSGLLRALCFGASQLNIQSASETLSARLAAGVVAEPLCQA
jgi:hypothetical protein